MLQVIVDKQNNVACCYLSTTGFLLTDMVLESGTLTKERTSFGKNASEEVLID